MWCVGRVYQSIGQSRKKAGVRADFERLRSCCHCATRGAHPATLLSREPPVVRVTCRADREFVERDKGVSSATRFPGFPLLATCRASPGKPPVASRNRLRASNRCYPQVRLSHTPLPDPPPSGERGLSVIRVGVSVRWKGLCGASGFRRRLLRSRSRSAESRRGGGGRSADACGEERL